MARKFICDQTKALHLMRWGCLAAWGFLASASAAMATLMDPGQQKFYEKEVEIEKQSNDFNHSNDRPTVAELSQLKLGDVRWINIDVRSALLNLANRLQSDPKGARLKFVIQWPEPANGRDVLNREIRNNVCIGLSKPVSIFELLMDLSGQTNFAFVVRPDEIILQPWRPGAYLSLNLDL